MGPRAGLDEYEKSRLPPGFDTRTVQSVASPYTNWATPALAYVLVVVVKWRSSGVKA